jgi:hypothetical protein
MSRLLEIFDRGTGGNCDKWRHYFEIYERYFGKFVGSQCTYLEIGVQGGGSLSIMREYLGDRSRIIGIDVDPNCAKLAQPGREIHIGNASDPNFLKTVATETAPFDIIVDDGGHVADQQLVAFLNLFPYLNYGGIYLVEDLHCQFWHGYQGSRFGINFYDFAKGLVEKMALWNIDLGLLNRYKQPPENRQGAVQFNNFAVHDLFGIHFYDSVVVLEKRKIAEPYSERK